MTKITAVFKAINEATLRQAVNLALSAYSSKSFDGNILTMAWNFESLDYDACLEQTQDSIDLEWLEYLGVEIVSIG